KFTSSLVDRVSTKSAAPLAFGMGLIVSFTLLPCSAGPYLVALSLIAGLSDFERYSALAIYNLVFVVPLIFILISLGIAAQVSSKIKKFRSEKMTLLNLISASLLISICIWALFQ
ncbi:MAG: cytochrome c biogenesis protein CcdA, partial [Thaumarchaeota archaeon]